MRVVSYQHFRNQAKVRARYKANNATRKRRPGELPQSIDESGETRPFEPTDHREGDVAETAIDNLFIDDLIAWAEGEGEPIYTIMLDYLRGATEEATAEQLKAKGIEMNVDAIRSRRYKWVKRIKKTLGDNS